MAKSVRSGGYTTKDIVDRIFIVRGTKIMLDRDLAEMYNVEVKVLNQAVKRNTARFPQDFMFQLNDKEWKNLKSQFVTSSLSVKSFAGKEGRRDHSNI